MRRYFSGRTVPVSLFALVNLADALTTQAGLAAGISEGNPLPALILAHGGMLAFLLVKASLVLWVAALPGLLPRFRSLRLLPYAGSAALALAVASNLALLA